MTSTTQTKTRPPNPENPYTWPRPPLGRRWLLPQELVKRGDQISDTDGGAWPASWVNLPAGRPVVSPYFTQYSRKV